MSYTIEDALTSLRTANVTCIVVNRQGEIAELIGRQDPPDPAFILSLNDRFRGMACRIRTKGQYSAADVEEMIRDLLEAFKKLDAGELRSGVNLG